MCILSSNPMRLIVRLSVTIAVLAFFFAAGTVRAEAKAPPHIVLIILDTLRADRVGCYGFELETSPEIDEIAAKGVRFANAISQSPWTRPSIASMLTSLHPRTLGIYDERGEILADRFQTLAEVLRDHGYRTIGSTANPNINPAFGFQQGFDQYWGTENVWEWMVPERGQERAVLPELPPARVLLERILADRFAETPKERARPHYVQVNLMDVHQADARKELIRPQFRGLFGEIEPTSDRRYLWGLRQVSRDTAEFIRKWSASPGFEDTLFVIVSDHGQGLSSHPDLSGWEHRHHGFYLFESLIKVPWILYHPGGRLPAGLVVERPVRLLEVMPTILDIVGIRGPTAMVGRSLTPTLEGEPGPELPKHFIVETAFRSRDKIGLYSDRWKYFENRDREPGLSPRALHSTGVMENGLRSDVGARHPKLLDAFAAKIAAWEKNHPKAMPVLRHSLSELEEQQLRSLGYLE